MRIGSSDDGRLRSDPEAIGRLQKARSQGEKQRLNEKLNWCYGTIDWLLRVIFVLITFIPRQFSAATRAMFQSQQLDGLNHRRASKKRRKRGSMINDLLDE
jgi:hypothetical protein